MSLIVALHHFTMVIGFQSSACSVLFHVKFRLLQLTPVLSSPVNCLTRATDPECSSVPCFQSPQFHSDQDLKHQCLAKTEQLTTT